MLRSFSSLRNTVGFAVVLPLALLVSACEPSKVIGGAGGASSSVSAGVTGAGGQGGSGGSVAGSDTLAPAVVATFPGSSAENVASNGAITATFSEPMDPLTITGVTFRLQQGAVDIPGAVSYFTTTAMLVPSVPLGLGVMYTATITTTATDLAGNHLIANHVWSFTTDASAPKGPAPVLLGAAGGYAILAKAAITNVPTSVITGNLGLSPAAASYITGFSMTRQGTKWTTPQVIGGVFAADNDPTTPADMTTSIGAMEAAYTDAAGRPTPDFLNLGTGAIGGLTLIPGLYTWSTSVTMTSDVEIKGAPNDVWIFQISGDLSMSSAKRITLSGGAQARNIFWQVAGLVDLGTTAHAEGVILSKTLINLGTGASIGGRLLAQTAVNLASSTVTAPTP
jgi:Ice-binding-like/Bacterial Ig-like domain